MSVQLGIFSGSEVCICGLHVAPAHRYPLVGGIRGQEIMILLEVGRGAVNIVPGPWLSGARTFPSTQTGQQVVQTLGAGGCSLSDAQWPQGCFWV